MRVARPSENGVVWVEDETLRQGFTQIPNVLLRRPDLTVGAKLTYMVLLSYAWQQDSCFPGQLRMAADMGVSDRSVRTYLGELIAKGLLDVRRRGLGLTNLYLLKRIPLNGTGNVFRSESNRTGNKRRSGAATSAAPEPSPASAQDRQELPGEEDPVDEQTANEDAALRPSAPIEQIWQAALEELSRDLSPAAFETWLKNTSARMDRRGRFTIQAPNAFALEWIELRFRPQIEGVLTRIIGRPTPIQVVVRA